MFEDTTGWTGDESARETGRVCVTLSVLMLSWLGEVESFKELKAGDSRSEECCILRVVDWIGVDGVSNLDSLWDATFWLPISSFW